MVEAPLWEALWILWLIIAIGGFVKLEGAALFRKEFGDTLTENIRRWGQIRADGKFVKSEKIVLGILLFFTAVGIWLPGHIFVIWP